MSLFMLSPVRERNSVRIVLVVLGLILGTLVTTSAPAEAKPKTVYYYFSSAGGPKGPLGDEFIVLRVRGNKAWAIVGMWGSEGAIGKATVSQNKVSIKYKFPECDGSTSVSTQNVKRKGARNYISLKGHKRGLKAVSLSKLNKKYVAIGKAMYPGHNTSWVEKDYFTQEFKSNDGSNWMNDSYC